MKKITKHKVKASALYSFMEIWHPFVARLKEAGEKIVRARLVFDDTSALFSGFRATIWTKREEEVDKK